MSKLLYPNQLTYIHIVKNKLKLSDDEYRDYLEEWTGKRSAKDLFVNEAIEVTEKFDAMLAARNTNMTMKLVSVKKTTKWVQKPGGLSEAQYGCIMGKSRGLKFSDEQLLNFIEHTIKQKIAPEDLKVKQASNVISGLIQREKDLKSTKTTTLTKIK